MVGSQVLGLSGFEGGGGGVKGQGGSSRRRLGP